MRISMAVASACGGSAASVASNTALPLCRYVRTSVRPRPSSNARRSAIGNLVPPTFTALRRATKLMPE